MQLLAAWFIHLELETLARLLLNVLFMGNTHVNQDQSMHGICTKETSKQI